MIKYVSKTYCVRSKWNLDLLGVQRLIAKILKHTVLLAKWI